MSIYDHFVDTRRKRVKNKNIHCVKSVQIWSFSRPSFPVFGLNTGKYGPEKTPYLNTFHAVIFQTYKDNHKVNLLKI